MKTVLMILFLAFQASAGETVSGTVAGIASGAGSSGNFAKEMNCGSALLASEYVSVRGFHGVPGKGLVVSAKRDERAGFYLYGAKGAAFSEIGSTKPTSENFKTKNFDLQITVPGSKDKTDFVYKQSVQSGDEAGFELKSAAAGAELASEEANDLFAQNVLIRRFSQSIASISKGIPGRNSMMFPALVKLQRETVQKELSKVVCGCKDVEELREPLSKMRASKELKPFETKFDCE